MALLMYLQYYTKASKAIGEAMAYNLLKVMSFYTVAYVTDVI